MRVVVCGGYDFKDRELLNKTLDEFHKTKPITCLIHSGARGAATFAAKWAFNNEVRAEAYKISNGTLKRVGKSATHLRNQTLLTEAQPELVIAFRGDNDTFDLIERATKAKIPIQRIGWGQQQPLNFSSEAERRDWLISHADYFTVIWRKNRNYSRRECPTLDAAEAGARQVVEKNPGMHVLIYAVAGPYDTYVKTVK